jgi:hypothetical protein
VVILQLLVLKDAKALQEMLQQWPVHKAVKAQQAMLQQ